MAWSSDPDRYGPPLPKKLKRQVLRDHNGVCHVCGKPGGDEVDHVVNRRSGGSDDLSNLRPIHHYPCHLDKIQQEATAARKRRTHREPPQHPARKRTE